MTAANAYQTQKPLPASNQEPRSREPSMEDILASIRRIIADDQLQAGRSAFGNLRRGSPSAISGPVAAEDHQGFQPNEAEHRESGEEVLDLAKMPEAVVQESYHSPVQETRESEPPRQSQAERYVVADEVTSANGHGASYQPQGTADLAPAEIQAEPVANYDRVNAVPPLREVQSASEGAEPLISPKLGASVVSAFESLAATVVLQNADMLDRVMHDLMRPMIKSWLDENLPTLVERLVRVEIERVARGGRPI